MPVEAVVPVTVKQLNGETAYVIVRADLTYAADVFLRRVSACTRVPETQIRMVFRHLHNGRFRYHAMFKLGDESLPLSALMPGDQAMGDQ